MPFDGAHRRAPRIERHEEDRRMKTDTTYTKLRSFARALVGAAAVVSLAACESDATSPEGNVLSGGESLAVARFGALATSARGGGNDAERVRTVVTSDAAWTQLWASLAPDPAASAGGPPAVDFSKEMVIAAVMPVRPSGGYRIQIERVTEYADRIEVEVAEHSPGPACFTTGVITRPFDVVQVPRRDGKPVQFRERTSTDGCNVAQRGDTLRAKLGQSVEARGVKVTLQRVVSDSRCPMNAVCIWEGDAAVALRFEASGRALDVTLHTNQRGGVVSATVGGAEFQLIGLTPYPVDPGPQPPQGDYTAILLVR
jgi:hypothetical protein